MVRSAAQERVSNHEASRVPGAMQRVKSAFTRVFNALWLRRPGTIPRSESGMAPDQQRTAIALRSIRGTPHLLSTVMAGLVPAIPLGRAQGIVSRARCSA